ncbi:MAG TPA: OsmC family protein [Phycisphaerae bacterium]|nr:OsmC family protein [Phycisphaerae bacterium]
MTVQTKVNGVEVDQLKAAVAQFRRNPEAARFQFRAVNRWIDAWHNRASVQDFTAGGTVDESRGAPKVFDEDEPVCLLGHDDGANPVEYVLTALSGCLTMALIAQASVRGIELEEVESELSGDIDLRGYLGIDPGVRNGYEKIRVTFHIKSDAPREVLEQLVQGAQARSPVFDVVTHATPVEVTLAE